jgi:branched-chain amino acid transport system substrate-binding protein
MVVDGKSIGRLRDSPSAGMNSNPQWNSTLDRAIKRKEGKKMYKRKRKSDGKLTRREFLKSAGATAVVLGGSMGFPGIVKYGLGEVPIKIGVILPLSGMQSAQGAEMSDATTLAIEHINEKGGVLGRKVEAIIRDDANNAAQIATRAKELIEKEKVNFLAGGASAATTHAQHQQSYPRKILCMANGMSNDIPAVPMFSKYTFHPDITPWMCANVLGRFTAEKLGKRWYFLVADYAYGWQNYESFSVVLKEYKGVNLGVSPHPVSTDLALPL